MTRRAWGGIALVVLVGVLAGRTWLAGRHPSSTGAWVSTQRGGLSLEAALDPDPPVTRGDSLLVTVHDPIGNPVDGATVTVEYDMPPMGGMSEMKGRADVRPERDGRYRARFDLPMTGTWTLRVHVESPRGTASQEYAMTVGVKGLTAAGVPGEASVVTIDDARRQLIGVRTAPVTAGDMQRTFWAVGRVAYDESSLSDVTLRVRGWITKLYASATGQRVARGQPLFSFYSPELYNAQRDLLSASSSPDIARAARQRLVLLGMDEGQIDAVVKRNGPREDVTVPSPASGFVIEKNVVEGAAVETGARLFRIAALDKVWVEADVYEHDVPLVRVGQPASVSLDYVPGRSLEARVAYVYPYLDDKARTGRVRFEIENRDLELRPGMYATVQLSADLGTRTQVPASAVVYTGPRRIVFVDLGEGRFMPKEVQLGVESGGAVEVTSGLEPGDEVAVSGVFLIAAEARIHTTADYWDARADGGAPASSESYICPMHPEVRSAAPGKCPKCGMELVPMRAKP